VIFSFKFDSNLKLWLKWLFEIPHPAAQTCPPPPKDYANFNAKGFSKN